MFNGVIQHYRCKYIGGVHEVQNLQQAHISEKAARGFERRAGNTI